MVVSCKNQTCNSERLIATFIWRYWNHRTRWFRSCCTTKPSLSEVIDIVTFIDRLNTWQIYKLLKMYLANVIYSPLKIKKLQFQQLTQFLFIIEIGGTNYFVNVQNGWKFGLLTEIKWYICTRCFSELFAGTNSEFNSLR